MRETGAMVAAAVVHELEMWNESAYLLWSSSSTQLESALGSAAMLSEAA